MAERGQSTGKRRAARPARELEVVPFAMLLATKDGEIVRANELAGRALGRDARELAGASLSELIVSPRHGEAFVAAIQRVLRGDQVGRELLFRWRRGDGVERYLEASLAVHARRPKPLVAIGLADVTDQRERERQMILEATSQLVAKEFSRSAYEEFFFAALRSLPLGVLVVDLPSAKASFRNDAFKEIAPEEDDLRALMGEVEGRIRREDGSPCPKDELPLPRTIALWEPSSADLVLTSPRGEVPLHCLAAPISYGEKRAAILLIEDVRERRAEELRRRAAEVRVHALFEQATEAMIVVDSAFAEVLEINPAAERLLALSRGDRIGAHRLGALSAPASAPPLRAELERRIATARAEGVARFGWRALRGTETLDLDVTIQPLRLDRQELLLVQVRDVTQQRRLEEELSRSQKLEALGLLAGGVAHDFNNFLMTVHGYTELSALKLRDSTDGSAGKSLRAVVGEVASYLDSSLDVIGSAAALCEQLLAFGRRSKASFQTIDLNAVVSSSLAVAKPLLGSAIRLEVELAAGGCPIEGNAGEVERALLNLVINARDAMPRGGKLRIATRRARLSDLDARALELSQGDYAAVEVEDDGQGMTEEVKRRLFEPFFTTKGPGLGTGLGMSIVHGVVKRHGGRIRVDSEPERGTRMTLLFKPAAGSPERSGQTRAEKHALGSRPTVLVVDDDPRVLKITARLVQELGYATIEASSGATALEQAARAEVGLVLTDVLMPGMDGVELGRRIQAAHPRTKVLLVSGHTGDAFASRGIEEPPDVLRKPLQLETLRRRLREELGPEGGRA